MSVRGIKLVDLDASSLPDLPLDVAKVEKFRGQFQRLTTVEPVRVRLNWYSGRALLLDETGRHIVAAAHAEGRDFVLAEIIED